MLIDFFQPNRDPIIIMLIEPYAAYRHDSVNLTLRNALNL
ncbi:hypothetical protein Pcaca04_10550 [Pectobacterium carotovorum subsp. carotovorum]|nr:hypothetical protein Pcaca04_10550 [Pectobacterium carotovorum subsp. carotovorum]